MQWQFWELIPTGKGRGWANSAGPVTHHQQQSESQVTGPRHSVQAYSRVFYAFTPNVSNRLSYSYKLNIFWQSIKLPVLCNKCVINFGHNILRVGENIKSEITQNSDIFVNHRKYIFTLHRSWRGCCNFPLRTLTCCNIFREIIQRKDGISKACCTLMRCGEWWMLQDSRVFHKTISFLKSLYYMFSSLLFSFIV